MCLPVLPLTPQRHCSHTPPFEPLVGGEEIMSRKLSLLSFFLVILLATPSVIFAQGNKKGQSSNSRKFSFERNITTPCAEKEVRLRGEFQAQFGVTRDPSGNTFLRGDFDAKRITALGAASGRKYEAQGTSHIDLRGPSPTVFNYVFNFALNKVRSSDSLMGHVTFRIKVDSQARASTEILEVKIDCNSRVSRTLSKILPA